MNDMTDSIEKPAPLSGDEIEQVRNLIKDGYAISFWGWADKHPVALVLIALVMASMVTDVVKYF